MVLKRKFVADAIKVPHVGVSAPHADNMDDTDIGKVMQKKLKGAASSELDLGYLASVIYQRHNWSEGHTRLTDGIFCDYLRETCKLNLVTADNRRILVAMDVYEGFARFNDDTIMKNVRLVGISKAHICLGYMDDDITAERVSQMLTLVRKTPSTKLRDALRTFAGFGPNGGGKRTSREQERARDVLRTLKPQTLLNDELFVPRQIAQERATELGWLYTFEAARKALNLDKDQMFAEMMKAWSATLPANILSAAEEMWKSKVVVQFPFTAE